MQCQRGSGGLSKIIEVLDLQGGISLLRIAEYKRGETVRVNVMSAVGRILLSKLSGLLPPSSFLLLFPSITHPGTVVLRVIVNLYCQLLKQAEH